MKKIILFGVTFCLVTSPYARTSQKREKSPIGKEMLSSSDPASSILITSTDDRPGSHDMMEEEEYEEPFDYPEGEENEMLEQEKMEDTNEIGSSVLQSEHAIDYNDRTRTDRERKALNTSSHASDDE
jgi:hypothetical protein